MEYKLLIMRFFINNLTSILRHEIKYHLCGPKASVKHVDLTFKLWVNRLEVARL